MTRFLTLFRSSKFLMNEMARKYPVAVTVRRHFFSKNSENKNPEKLEEKMRATAAAVDRLGKVIVTSGEAFNGVSDLVENAMKQMKTNIDSDIAKLDEKHSQLRTEAATLQNTCRELINTVRQLKTQTYFEVDDQGKPTLKSKLDAFANQLTVFEQTITALSAAIIHFEEKTLNLEIQYSENIDSQGQPTLKTKIITLQHGEQELRNRVDQLNTQINLAVDDQGRPTLKAQVEQLETTVARLLTHAEQINTLEDRVNTLENSIVTFGRQVIAFDGRFTAVRQELNAITTELATVKENFKEDHEKFKKEYFKYTVFGTVLLALALAYEAYTDFVFKRITEAKEKQQTKDLTETQKLKSELEGLMLLLKKQPTNCDVVLQRVAQEIQRLQIAYNHSFSASWLLSPISRGYEHQLKIQALTELEKEIIALSAKGYRAITADLIPLKTHDKISKAYSYPLVQQDEDFYKTLDNEFKLIR